MSAQIEILLVEDNPGDVRLTLTALKNGKLNNRTNVVNDGVQALAYLHHEGAYKDKPHPDLIVLDLNLPKKSGHEVLAEIKQDPKLGLIPVIILTTSNAESDILKTYALHANCYISKPVELEQFVEVVQQIESFWLGIVHLPTRSK